MTEVLRFERTSPALAAESGARPLRRADGTRGLDRIEVHADPQHALAAWAELEAVAPGSLYQTRRWLLPWIATAGRAAGIEPMLIVGCSEGQPVVFCPFGIAKRGGLRVAGFLGAKDSNANLALFRPGREFSRAELVWLFKVAAAKAAAKPDLFLLSNQPAQWENVGNPLVGLLPHQPSPSYCHRSDLAPQFDVFVRSHLSKDARKKLRQKEKRLAEIGLIAHLRARTENDVHRILETFVTQKRERLAQMGVAAVFDDPSARAFLETAALQNLAQGEAAIEFHALTVGDRIIATFAGGTHRGHFHGMVNSFDLDSEVARSSPGELLLARILEEKCHAGMTGFDLGIGEARYKDTWCDVAEPLFDTILPVSMKGRAAALGESLRLRMKRAVKQNGWAWMMARKLRAR